MKKFILLAASASALCAGALITPKVDYDREDVMIARASVPKKLILPAEEKPIVTVPGVRKTSYGYGLNLLVGENFADNDSIIKDATIAGIRLNKYITDTVAIQLGYDRIFNANYKLNKLRRTLREKNLRCDVLCDTCETPQPGETSENGNDGQGTSLSDTNNNIPQENTDTSCQSNTGCGQQESDQSAGTASDSLSGDTSDITSGGAGKDTTENTSYGQGADNGNPGNQTTPTHNAGDSDQTSSNSGAENGGNTNPLETLGNRNLNRSTDIDRFYLNALKEMPNDKTRLIPYFFAGFGYEHVNDKNLGFDSQGFFNTGGGLKYSLSDQFRLVSEAKVIKKFKDERLDIAAMIGVGLLFDTQTTAPVSEKSAPTVEPKPEPTLIIPEEKTSETIPEIPAPAVTKPIERITLSTPPATQKSHYVIQIAVVKNPVSLRNLKKAMAKQDLKIIIKKIKIKGEPAYRILAGGYASKAEAMRDLKKARKIAKGAYIKKV